MGITVSYRRISPENFAEIQGSRKLPDNFFDNEESSFTEYRDKASVYADNLDTTKTQLSIEKEWQAIHYLLTGEIAFDETKAEPPLSNVVLGGTPTKIKASYGYVRYLTLDEVKDIALALNQVSREDLRTRFDSRGNAKIYAQGEEWDEEDWMFLMEVQDDLVRFFNEAAANNEVILISSD